MAIAERGEPTSSGQMSGKVFTIKECLSGSSTIAKNCLEKEGQPRIHSVGNKGPLSTGHTPGRYEEDSMLRAALTAEDGGLRDLLRATMKG